MYILHEDIPPPRTGPPALGLPRTLQPSTLNLMQPTEPSPPAFQELHSPLAADVMLEQTWLGRSLENLLQRHRLQHGFLLTWVMLSDWDLLGA